MTAAESIRTLPQRFNPESVAPDAETCFHYRISGEGGGEFTVTIKDRQCNVQDGLQGSPKCVIQTSGDMYMDIINGKQNPQMAILMGKLKVSDIAEMMRFHKLFWLI
jgi:putative sterol carrier protein